MVHTAAEDAARLVGKYGTRDPFELAAETGAEVIFTDLGSLKGMYTYIQHNRFIVISNALDEATARIVCAHELGHDQLHRALVKDSFLQETMLYNMKNRTEYEANVFAAELLLSDEDILRNAEEGMDIDTIAAVTETDVNLVALKLADLRRRGYELNWFDYRADFLKSR
ncbi:MAG: ImmA/IrrE family metallo-endopeptidase [Clostridia bacterium]|nr:ImmA/IrrE family metallo-endopeptidase [Clostridia bacterium]